MATDKDFITFFTHLKTIVPRYAPTSLTDQQVAQLWYPAFKEYSMDDYRKVFAYARAGLTEFPGSVAELKAYFDKALGRRPDETRDIFADLIRWVAGGARTPVDHMLARVANRFGGARVVGAWPEEDYPFRRKEVEQVYRELLKNIDAYEREDLKRIESPAPVVKQILAQAFDEVANAGEGSNRAKPSALRSFMKDLKRELAIK